MRYKMPATINWPMPNGIAIAHGDQNGPPALSASTINPDARYQAPAANSAFGNSRHDANMPRLNRICHRPGSIHRLSGAKPHQHEGQERAGHGRGDELLQRRVDHLVRHGEMQPPRPRHGLGADQRGGDDGGADPDGEIGADLLAWTIEPQRLHAGCQHRDDTGQRDRGRTIAAELGGARHLPLDRVDVGERLAQFLHRGPVLYDAKYTTWQSSSRAVLSPQQRTWAGSFQCPLGDQSRHLAPQQNRPLLDHLVSAGEQHRQRASITRLLLRSHHPDAAHLALLNEVNKSDVGTRGMRRVPLGCQPVGLLHAAVDTLPVVLSELAPILPSNPLSKSL